MTVKNYRMLEKAYIFNKLSKSISFSRNRLDLADKLTTMRFLLLWSIAAVATTLLGNFSGFVVEGVEAVPVLSERKSAGKEEQASRFVRNRFRQLDSEDADSEDSEDSEDSDDDDDLPAISGWEITNTVTKTTWRITTESVVRSSEGYGANNTFTLRPLVRESAKSMWFGYNNQTRFLFLNSSPFYLCKRDSKSVPLPCAFLTYGRQCLYATPFEKKEAKGLIGRTDQFCFTILPPLSVTVASNVSSGSTSAQIQLQPTAIAQPPPTAQALPLAPLSLPAKPVVATDCTRMPQFDGDWEPSTAYPLRVGEGYGGLIGNDFVVVGGYYKGYAEGASHVYAYDTATVPVSSNSTGNTTTKVGHSVWREMDSMPMVNDIGPLLGGAHVIVGDKIFICGGSIVGINKTVHSSDACLVYTHINAPGTQWSTLPNLPSTSAAGALLYNRGRHSLLYGGGVTFSNPLDPTESTETDDMYELLLNDLKTGWKSITNIPEKASHFGYTTIEMINGTTNTGGNSYHYFFGGIKKGDPKQKDDIEDKRAGMLRRFKINTKEKKCMRNLFSYDVNTKKWTGRKGMTFGLGEVSTITYPTYKTCGFLAIGGRTNGNRILTTVQYYNHHTDQWMTLGELPFARRSPVCTIDVRNEYLYCQIGGPREASMWRRRII